MGPEILESQTAECDTIKSQKGVWLFVFWTCNQVKQIGLARHTHVGFIPCKHMCLNTTKEIGL